MMGHGDIGDPSTDVVTLSEAGEYLDLSVTTVRNIVYRGKIEAVRAKGSGRIVGVTVDSVMRFDRDHPKGANGKRSWSSSSRIEPHIYKEPRKGGQVTYRVKIHGLPGRSFKQLRSAQLYRDSLIDGHMATQQETVQSASHTQSFWSRIRAWLNASDTTTA